MTMKLHTKFFMRAPTTYRRLAAVILLATASVASAQAQTQPAAPLTCAPTGVVELPSGVSIERVKLLDDGKHYNIYTSIEDSDDREGRKNMLPASMAGLVDMSPSGLNRILADTMLAARRFKVFDMRANVTAEHSDVLVTAKVVDADQVLKPFLEGGRRVSESRVKLSVQAKNMYTGENLFDADVFVEGKTGMITGDRVIVTSADDPNSAEIRNRLATDFKNAMFRSFRLASERIEHLLRPMARVVGAQDCGVDLFGGSRSGLQRGDELVIFRAQKRQLGDSTILSGTRAVALVRCAGVGTESTHCAVMRAVAGYRPQDGDYAVITDASLERSRAR
jgi:hypothetical protein